MIERLRGRVAQVAPERALVDVHGVGFGVHVSTATASRLPPPGQEVTLVVRTLLPRGEDLVLYGFPTDEEAALFDRLCAVSGVGPAVALRLLAITPARLTEAIRAREVKPLQQAPGVGAKIARRIITELAEALPPPEEPAGPAARAADPQREGLITAFSNLQFSDRRRVEEAVDAVIAELPDETMEARFRAALARLAPRGTR